MRERRSMCFQLASQHGVSNCGWQPPLRGSLFLLFLLLSLPAIAQTTEAQRVVNETHHFAFTVEAGSFITLRKGGNGFSAIHKPRGAGDTAYGVLVFGSPDYALSDTGTAAAREAGKLPTRNSPVNSQERLDELVAIDMQALGREESGAASVKLPDGGTLSVPVYAWTQGSGSRQRHAIMYVVLHGTSYVAVQVEASSPLSSAQIKLLTQSLELLEDS